MLDIDRLTSNRLIPARSVEDIMAGRIRLRLDGTDYELPVLAIRENRAWKERLELDMGALLEAINDADENVLVIMQALMSMTDKLEDLLYAYDQTSVLPPREDLEAKASDVWVFRAVLEVWAAANPLVGIGVAVAARTAMPETKKDEPDEPPETPSPAPMSSPPGGGAGPIAISKETSPTSSSSSTLTRRSTKKMNGSDGTTSIASRPSG